MTLAHSPAPTTAERIRSTCVQAGGALLAVDRAEPLTTPLHHLLADGSFSSTALADVGEAVTAFLIDRRGKTLFPRFVQQLVNGASPADAFRDVYSSDPRALADDFLQQAAKAARGDNN